MFHRYQQFQEPFQTFSFFFSVWHQYHQSDLRNYLHHCHKSLPLPNFFLYVFYFLNKYLRKNKNQYKRVIEYLYVFICIMYHD